MNWITKFIKPKIQSILKRQSKKTEDSLWVACDCQEPIFKDLIFFLMRAIMTL